MTKNKIERVSFEVTGKCNLHCFYCCRGYLNTPEKISNELSTGQIIETIIQARKEGCESFLFTGGEAFVKENFDKILKECEGCFIEIYSNGTLITEPKNLILIKKYVSRLTVTLDGTSSHNFYRKNSNYLKILDNLKKVKEKTSDVKIKINTLVHDKSVKELLKLYNLLKDLKIDEWHIDFPQLRGRLAEFNGKFSADYIEIGRQLKKVLKKYYRDGEPFYLKIYKIFSSKIDQNNFFEVDLKENPCAYKTDYSMFVNAEGKYILCPSIPCQDITIANISKNTFNEAIKKKKNLTFQKMKFSDLKKCLNCRYFDLCLGGCRGEAKILSNSFLEPDLNACSLMKIAEKIIYPSLPKKISKIYIEKIKKMGKYPDKPLKNLDEMKSSIQKRYTFS
ncbi:MAG: radical SAM protein [Candidatus Nanoarchaeia archaeon]|nr:radical SAM protein [Candidatus Nanoarchaeia archaeon]MDD5358057.1 radical SAM protein [Candidatus Nanoarchaeia archaeon]MDD5589245.1 radical SAM protein [Candidatus Nanoarchaeia archaeon]